MKKFVKTILCLALISAVLFSFTACGDKEKVYSGEYDNQPYYCKVNITVKGEKIIKVELEPDTAEKYNVTPDKGNYKEIFNNGKAKILKYYEGKTLDEVAALKEAEVVSGEQSNSPYAVAGATQSSNRVLFAIQNAISKIKEEKK